MIIDKLTIFVNTASKLNQNPSNVSVFKYLVMASTISLHFDHLCVIIDVFFMTIYQMLQLLSLMSQEDAMYAFVNPTTI